MQRLQRQDGFLPADDNRGFDVSLVPVLDQRQESCGGLVSPWMGYKCAQTFRAGVSGLLCRVELSLQITGTVGAASVSVIRVIRNLPSNDPADVLVKSTVSAPLSQGWNAFDFVGKSITLVKGGQYALVLEPWTACDWHIKLDSSPYGEGVLCEQWGDEPWDVVWPGSASFRTYVQPFPETDQKS